MQYSFRFPETIRFFKRFLCQDCRDDFFIKIDEDWFMKAKELMPLEKDDSYVEFRALIGLTGRELLRFKACVFHCVSFLWNGKAFLLAAPSGTGKSTQYFNWERLFPGEISMISGDMPILECRSDGSVWAYPSPWNGKEHVGGHIPGKVSGIVFLVQGEENNISQPISRDLIQPFFNQFIVRPETNEQICSLAHMIDQMIKNVPCFKLVNRGDDASTTMLRETLEPLAKGGQT